MYKKSINFGSYLYNRLPELYRREDAKDGIDFALKRFLEVLDEGGLQLLFGELLTLYDIFDVDTCPKEVLPLISRLLGYNFIDEVDETMQRKIISNLVELYKRKGTKSVINFITREFTHFDTKVVETQYRLFKTWSPKPKGIPDSSYVEPRTLGLGKPNADTCCLFSSQGLYNYQGIIVICDAQTSQVELLNRLLREFLPVYCNLYIQIKDGIESYVETARMQGNEVSQGLTLKDIERSVLANVSDSVRVRYNVDTESVNGLPTETVKARQSTSDHEGTTMTGEEANKSSVANKTEETTTMSGEEKTTRIATIQDSENPKVNITFEYKDNTTKK